MGVQAIESDFQGPLEEGTVGLLLGRSSSTLKGLIIHPGVIDSDYTGMVKIMVESPRELDQRPTLKIKINGKDILGLLDTGADRSIIASKDWPPKWPKQASSQSLRGLGYSETPEMSAVMLRWEDAEGHSGTVQPYVLDLPISLWGRDLLKDMNYKLSNEYSRVSQKLMKDMGHHPNYGIGKFLQGRNEPTEVVQRPSRQGLGFS
ncbi:endogenous retrovirus group K member 7 Pro protein-like [Oryctolagus cuniculus]|uniref:endogenous retrovirus group K member 7 Pro protein-like n=1 Tax=Oryctolagus cuniculus TaxID=9986 RepID=UPI003879F60C